MQLPQFCFICGDFIGIMDDPVHDRMEVETMLCQFTVKNYKSIREEMTFDMQAAAIIH